MVWTQQASYEEVSRSIGLRRSNGEGHYSTGSWIFALIMPIWKTTQDPENHENHRHFIDNLIYDMTHYDLFTPTLQKPLERHPEYLDRRGRCIWGRRTAGGCVQGTKRDRTVLGEVSGNAEPVKRPRQVRTGCKQRGVHLCIDRDCWHRHHASNSCK